MPICGMSIGTPIRTMLLNFIATAKAEHPILMEA
jgi:hypothetical protein